MVFELSSSEAGYVFHSSLALDILFRVNILSCAVNIGKFMAILKCFAS